MRAIVSGAIAGLVVVVIAVAVALAVVPGIAPLAASPSPAATIALLYPTPSPTPAPSASPSPSPSPTPSPTPTPSPVPCPTAKPGASASPPACPTPAPTPPPAPTPSPTPIPGVGLAIGSQAPPLSLDLLGGGTVDLASLRGQPVWIIFMASWTPGSRSELPLVLKDAAALGDRMAIVVVDVREDATTTASFAKSMKLTMPVALDPTGRAQRAWGAFALPIHYWIDGDGIVRGVAYGGVSQAVMRSNIRALAPDASFAP